MSDCPHEKPSLNDCIDCQSKNQMPRIWCCLKECNTHDVCNHCKKGISLLTEKGEQDGE